MEENESSDSASQPETAPEEKIEISEGAIPQPELASEPAPEKIEVLISEPETVTKEKSTPPEGTETPENTETNAASYDPKNVHYEGSLAVYTDPSNGTQYEWSEAQNEWSLRQLKYDIEDDTHIYFDKDGTKFFWDKQKSAWFPKLDDDFMARYQMSYGVSQEPETEVKGKQKKDEKEEEEEDDEDEEETPKKEPLPQGEKRKATEPNWFDVNETENTKVYVSHLPTDITEQEFVDLMQKYGLVMRDPCSGNYKIKLYKDPGTNYLKGDALCTYIKIESVELALKLLDGFEYNGHKIRCERAQFQMKGEYDPKLKPKMKKRKEKLKLKKAQEKLFDWRPEKPVGERAKHEKVVIVRNLFEPSIFDEDVGLILEFQEDLREEVGKLGTCRKVIIFDRHPEGIAQINMTSPEEAEEVVKLLNGRWFMKRLLTAEIWDGKTKFKIAETDAQISDRLDNWDKFLEDGEEKKT